MIALIGARGGSKELPGKNILPIAGKPLIQWSIESALYSKSISEVYVSTDSEDIASISESCGAKVPFLRPKKLSGSRSESIGFIRHFINNCRSMEGQSSLCVLQPTSPLRSSEDIDNAVDIFEGSGADSVVSVSRIKHPLSWVFKTDDQGILYSTNKTEWGSQQLRQSSCPHYLPNGAIFIYDVKFILNKDSYLPGKCYPYIMESHLSIDIDNIYDFKIAELMLSSL